MQKRQREMRNVLAKNVEKRKEKEKRRPIAVTVVSNIITSSQKINDMIQTIQKEVSYAALVVEASEESLLESNQTSSTPALTKAERKAYRNIEQKLPTLMTGLFEGDTPEFSEYEVAFKEAQKVLLMNDTRSKAKFNPSTRSSTITERCLLSYSRSKTTTRTKMEKMETTPRKRKRERHWRRRRRLREVSNFL